MKTMTAIYRSITLAALTATMMASCQMKEDDIFDIDPATRQDNWMAEYRRVFNNNEHGWALYTSQPTYGRHPSVQAFAVRFDQERCTFYKSSATGSLPGMAGVDSVQSLYSFKMDNGIVLSFDTYNAFFHYYADQSEYFSQDLQGDFEFCLDRFSENEDTIFGRGKTKQLPFFMVKMHMTPEEYQAKSDSIDNYAATNCLTVIGGDSLQTQFLSGYKNLLINFPDVEGGPVVEHMYSYGNLTTGIYMMENIKYKGTTVVEFNLDKVTGTFHDPRSGARIVGRPLTDYLMKDDSYDNWFFGYSGLGAYSKGEWDKMREAIDASGLLTSQNIISINFEPYADGTMDLVINKWYGIDEVRYPMELRKVSDSEIAIRRNGEETSGRDFSFYDAGLKYLVDAFAKSDSWTTYKITHRIGNSMQPNGFELTDEANPGNSYYVEPNFRYFHASMWE